MELTLISDASCKNYYDVNEHTTVLSGEFGINLSSTVSVDVSDAAGKKLVSEYKITKVPTFILTGDVAVYPSLTSIWQQVGSVEKDGAYVFRDVAQMVKFASI